MRKINNKPREEAERMSKWEVWRLWLSACPILDRSSFCPPPAPSNPSSLLVASHFSLPLLSSPPPPATGRPVAQQGWWPCQGQAARGVDPMRTGGHGEKGEVRAACSQGGGGAERGAAGPEPRWEVAWGVASPRVPRTGDAEPHDPLALAPAAGAGAGLQRRESTLNCIQRRPHTGLGLGVPLASTPCPEGTGALISRP